MNKPDTLPLNILRSWHLIEFFQPFDFENPKNGERGIKFTEHELGTIGNKLLPWQNPEVAQRHQLEHYRGQYELYIAVFSNSEVDRISNRLFGRELDPNAELKQTEPLESLKNASPLPTP